MAGQDYVYSGTTAAAEIALRSGKTRMLFLARYLAEAGPKMNTRCRDRNNLNMTRANLLVVSRRTHSQMNAQMMRQNTLHREAAAADAR